MSASVPSTTLSHKHVQGTTIPGLSLSRPSAAVSSAKRNYSSSSSHSSAPPLNKVSPGLLLSLASDGVHAVVMCERRAQVGEGEGEERACGWVEWG